MQGAKSCHIQLNKSTVGKTPYFDNILPGLHKSNIHLNFISSWVFLSFRKCVFPLKLKYQNTTGLSCFLNTKKTYDIFCFFEFSNENGDTL
jgi:hypothetical protein